MLTAAVRDLHACHPNQFLTDVRTCCPALWENNPHLTALQDQEGERIECSYPLINASNELPYHCLHGFMQFLSERLGVSIRPTAFRGDIHLSPLEKSWMSQVHEITGEDTPFWIIVAGGKFDYTIKWWASERFQRVVEHFRGRIQFVQVGNRFDYHPALRGVIDLRGKTDLRQLIRLVYHAQGVLCPITLAMHLAPAIETKGGGFGRPCVVVAGGREPAHWEEYPDHQFIHSNGALPCCPRGGCWRSRTHPLGDEDTRDQDLCRDVRGDLPRCMDMITAGEVISRIERYFDGGTVEYLRSEQAARSEGAIIGAFPPDKLTTETARFASEQFIRRIPPYPSCFEGQGIVICAGGLTYFVSAWVCISLLRHLGCTLPVQVWYLGETELDQVQRQFFEQMDVECVDALAVRAKRPSRILNGWELKAYSILHSPFEQVLLLDADNIPIVDPDFLFETKPFAETGAVFWPDRGRLGPERSIWKLCGVPYRDEPEFETGQVLVDKQRCWPALSLAMWYNEHSDFFYQHVHGDKETFHLAFRKLHQPYAMPSTPVHCLDKVLCQHDFEGRRIFQHRCSPKWNLDGNARIPDFRLEEECFEFVKRLRKRLSKKRTAQFVFNAAHYRTPGCFR